jgi:hypothetical protein
MAGPSCIPYKETFNLMAGAGASGFLDSTDQRWHCDTRVASQYRGIVRPQWERNGLERFSQYETSMVAAEEVQADANLMEGKAAS